jgi:hypothetical protein
VGRTFSLQPAFKPALAAQKRGGSQEWPPHHKEVPTQKKYEFSCVAVPRMIQGFI